MGKEDKLTPLEARRKLLHAFAGSAFALIIKEALENYSWESIFLVLFLLLISGSAISFAYISKAELPFFAWLIENFEREEYREKFPGKGVFMFLLGSMLTIAIFREPSIVSAAILIVSLGDGMSTLFGLKFGMHKIPYNSKKSIEGSAAFLAFAFLGATTQINFKAAFLSSFICMLVESIDLKIDDNLVIPLVAGFVIYLVQI